VADPRLTRAAQDLIANPDHVIFVSAASVWEIAIKHSLARGRPGDMPVSGAEALRFFHQAGYELLGITADHAAAVEALPPLHRDPFDRILVAQALVEPLRLITHDPMVKAYSDTAILV
jgi:PIN domain nuclease of toxin-antitoxin system